VCARLSHTAGASRMQRAGPPREIIRCACCTFVCRYLRVSSVHTLSFSLYTARRYILLGIIRCSCTEGEKYHTQLSVKRRMHNSRSLYIPLHKYTCVCVTSTTKQGSVFTINLCAVTQLSFTYKYIYARAQRQRKFIDANHAPREFPIHYRTTNIISLLMPMHRTLGSLLLLNRKFILTRLKCLLAPLVSL